ncbi:Recombination repair protein 1 [Frankliniella fusca]|uniref:DNA-(apurinic or apyrimidinic site) endonuclease n=1 Tax=Frankliniella fusca TaxID=407009 RepID=A0AAE1LKI2_9NEOP|nr:Recombination repair protein 1 [Frankliniella fusca]
MFCAAFRRFVVWRSKRFTCGSRVFGNCEFGASERIALSFTGTFLNNSSKGSNKDWTCFPVAQLVVPISMSPRGKAKAKKTTEENGGEKRVRESRNVKAASYKDLSDSEDEKPVRRRKKDSDSDASVSEEEKPKRVVAKGRRASARSKKEESESDEVSDFNSDESSGEDSRKKKKPARKPVRSLRTAKRTSYKDLSDSDEESNDDEEESSSEKEDKRSGVKRKRGTPTKEAKKSKKESSGSEEDEEEEEGDEDEEEGAGKKGEEEEVGEGKSKAEKPSSKNKSGDETSSDSGTKSKGESDKKSEKTSKPDHELSEEEDEEEKEQPAKSSSKGNEPKKRGRPPKNPKVNDDNNDDNDAGEEEEEPQPKKAKAGDKPLLNKSESNYASIDFSSEAKTKDGKLWNFKISSWNVAGLKAWVKKSGMEFLKHEDPDILCLQETKCSEKKLPPEAKVEGYHTYWLSGEKEGYAGVAVLSKTKPLEVKFGIDKPEFDSEGRVITAEYEKFYLVNVYVPNAGQGLKSLPRRLEWDPAFRAYLKNLDEKKPVILCGDLNVAHNEIDLANPKTNTKNAGFTPQEREGMSELLKQGFVDTFRNLYPDKSGAYSFWTYMSNARSRNVGWRLDYFITSERFMPQVCDNVIRNEVFGSDHCPITLFANV